VTTRKSRDLEDDGIVEQAVGWIVGLQEDSSVENRAAFSAWLKESPKNVEAFLRASALDTSLGEMGRERRLGELPDPLPDLASSVLNLGQARVPSAVVRRGFAGTKWLALAASVAVIAVTAGAFAWILTGEGREWREFASAVGEQRTIELEDGSVMYLAPGSDLELSFGSDERALRLKSGEAMFQVARDASRPFRVYSGDVIVQALGTRFTVNRHSRGDTVVAVTEGTVQVSQETGLIGTFVPAARRAAPVQVTAGQETRVAASGKVGAPKTAVVDRAEDLRNRRLTFAGEELATIADEFNRYNHTKIHIEGEAVGERRYALSINADDPESLMDVLRADGELLIERSERGIIIRSRN
jgi:transmembrane sensor